MVYGSTIKAQSTNEAVVIDCQHHTVAPYGSAKILTIKDVKLVEEIVLVYKVENAMSEKPVLVANYTEGNIACGTRSFHYYGNNAAAGHGYQITENRIKFVPSPQDWVSGNVPLTIFFVWQKDLKARSYMAISNVVSVRMKL